MRALWYIPSTVGRTTSVHGTPLTTYRRPLSMRANRACMHPSSPLLLPYRLTSRLFLYSTMRRLVCSFGRATRLYAAQKAAIRAAIAQRCHWVRAHHCRRPATLQKRRRMPRHFTRGGGHASTCRLRAATTLAMAAAVHGHQKISAPTSSDQWRGSYDTSVLGTMSLSSAERSGRRACPG